MKKMIKKYTQFIKENIENPSKLNLMDLMSVIIMMGVKCI
jgi:hypothetical protein